MYNVKPETVSVSIEKNGLGKNFDSVRDIYMPMAKKLPQRFK